MLARFEARSVGFALASALTITAYTLVDGSGARLSGSALPYAGVASCAVVSPWR
jgi:hypothetical protein